MSDSRREFQRAYEALKGKHGPSVRCADTGLLVPKHWAEPHHPMGRIGPYLLCFIWVSREGHESFHMFGKQARALGWILGPFEGRPYDPEEERAWPEWAEEHFPEEYKRPKVNQPTS